MRKRLVPLTGALYLLVVVIGFVVQGEPPSSDDPLGEVVDFYADNEGKIYFSAAIVVAGASLLVCFVSYLRKLLEPIVEEGSILPHLVFAGGLIIATTAALDSSLTFAAADAAGNGRDQAVETLNIFYGNDFLGFVLGNLLYMTAIGVAVLKTGLLPKAFGWIAVVFGLISLTPIGFVGFIGGGLWTLVVSIILFRRHGATAPPATPAAAAPPPTTG